MSTFSVVATYPLETHDFFYAGNGKFVVYENASECSEALDLLSNSIAIRMTTIDGGFALELGTLVFGDDEETFDVEFPVVPHKKLFAIDEVRREGIGTDDLRDLRSVYHRFELLQVPILLGIRDGWFYIQCQGNRYSSEWYREDSNSSPLAGAVASSM